MSRINTPYKFCKTPDMLYHLIPGPFGIMITDRSENSSMLSYILLWHSWVRFHEMFAVIPYLTDEIVNRFGNN